MLDSQLYEPSDLPGLGRNYVIREEGVNTFLAELLRDQGIAAHAERRDRNITPDIRVTLKTGDTVLLECKWLNSARQLENQLDTRLQQFPDAVGIIGVLYPEEVKYPLNTRRSLEISGDLEWWLHGSRGERVSDRRSRFGAPTDIADHLRVLALELEGADRRDVWDGFERTDAVTAYPMVENHDTQQRTRLVSEPDKYLAPLVEARPGRRLKSSEQLWQKAGRLLIAERLWLETNRVIAMRTDVRVLSNVWWPVKTDEIAHEKALAVWLNSGLGLLTLLAQRTSTEGS